MSDDIPIAYRCEWQDYRGWAEGRNRPLDHDRKNAPPPAVQVLGFPTQAEAEAHKAHLKSTHGPDLVVDVTPVYAPRAETRRPLLDNLPRMKKRLTE